MPKDTKTLGNSKARACESLGFVHKKGCARVLTQPHPHGGKNRILPFGPLASARFSDKLCGCTAYRYLWSSI